MEEEEERKGGKKKQFPRHLSHALRSSLERKRADPGENKGVTAESVASIDGVTRETRRRCPRESVSRPEINGAFVRNAIYRGIDMERWPATDVGNRPSNLRVDGEKGRPFRGSTMNRASISQVG